MLHNRKIPEPGERGGEGKVYKKQTFTSAWGTENIKITVKALCLSILVKFQLNMEGILLF